jgi:NADPH-ferrihemoprotein reductase
LSGELVLVLRPALLKQVLNGASNGTYSAPQSGPSTPVGNPSSFVDRMQAQGKDVVIFYGSQTGTAEDFASRMAMEAKLYGFNPLVADLEEFEIVCPPLGNHSECRTVQSTAHPC